MSDSTFGYDTDQGADFYKYSGKLQPNTELFIPAGTVFDIKWKGGGIKYIILEDSNWYVRAIDYTRYAIFTVGWKPCQVVVHENDHTANHNTIDLHIPIGYIEQYVIGG